MDAKNWQNELPSAITVCDSDGVIIYMNKRSIESFKADGGENLIGSNVLDCHPEPSRSKLKEMLSSGNSNIYTIEKNGVKKMIYQSPWYEDGLYKGFVEMSIVLPKEMPHFIRG